MLRALSFSVVLLVIAGPALADDMDLCRDRQTEAKARQDACEKVIAAGQVQGKDLAIAYGVRGAAFQFTRRFDKALAAFEAAHAADPDNPNYINGRGLAYEAKGDDEHAMADYNLVLQMRPNSPLARNNRGTLYMRQGGTAKRARRFQRRGRPQSKSLHAPHQSRAPADDQQGLRRRARGFCRSRKD